MVVVWLVLGAVLVAVELHHLAFYALFGAVGSFAAALVALVWPDAIALQAGVAVLVAMVGILAVRPFVSSRVHQRGDGHPARGVAGTLVGEEVYTLDVVGDGAEPGHVRLAGERWLAVSGSGHPIARGERVLVTAVQGTTLTVWPVGGGPAGPLPELPEGAEGEQS